MSIYRCCSSALTRNMFIRTLNAMIPRELQGLLDELEASNFAEAGMGKPPGVTWVLKDGAGMPRDAQQSEKSM